MKLCWNRANSHLALPLGIAEKVAIATLLLKSFNIVNWWFVGIAFATLILTLFIVGHLDVKYHVMSKENSLNNKYNLEMQRLLNK